MVLGCSSSSAGAKARLVFSSLRHDLKSCPVTKQRVSEAFYLNADTDEGVQLPFLGSIDGSRLWSGNRDPSAFDLDENGERNRLFKRAINNSFCAHGAHLCYAEWFRHQGEIMPEHRARKHHQDRVAETLREEIGAMIEGELSDPRINFCYVTEVAMNPGGKSARVYIAVDSSVKDIVKAEEETVEGLEAAKGYIRAEIKERMGVRTCLKTDFSGRPLWPLPGPH